MSSSNAKKTSSAESRGKKSGSSGSYASVTSGSSIVKTKTKENHKPSKEKILKSKSNGLLGAIKKSILQKKGSKETIIAKIKSADSGKVSHVKSSDPKKNSSSYNDESNSLVSAGSGPGAISSSNANNHGHDATKEKSGQTTKDGKPADNDHHSTAITSHHPPDILVWMAISVSGLIIAVASTLLFVF